MKEVAPKNIPTINSTLETFQLLSGWLKEVAPKNISFIVVTLDTFLINGTGHTGPSEFCATSI